MTRADNDLVIADLRGDAATTGYTPESLLALVLLGATLTVPERQALLGGETGPTVGPDPEDEDP